MDRWDLQAIRVYAPTVGLMLAGAASGVVVVKLAQSAVFSRVAETFNWVPSLLFAAALAHLTWSSWRLWRAHNGVGRLCSCGGILGGEIDGRWGPYRKCLACGRNVSAKHYE